LAVVDEQHRFGVHQRLAPPKKGEGGGVVGVTAGPRSRTPVVTPFWGTGGWGPRGKTSRRPPVDTPGGCHIRLRPGVGGIGRALADGRRVYWVCPLVEVTENTDLAAAEERFAALKQRFGAMADLVHGRMKGGEKDRAMERFAAGETRLLVATTVIEVG